MIVSKIIPHYCNPYTKYSTYILRAHIHLNKDITSNWNMGIKYTHMVNI